MPEAAGAAGSVGQFADFNHLFHGVGLYLTYLADPDTPAPRVRDKARRVAAYYLARRR